MISKLCLCKQLRAGAATCGRGKVQHIDKVCVNHGALGTCFPKQKAGQRTETNVLSTLVPRVRFSSHDFIYLKLQVPSNQWKSGTRHQIENFLP